MKAFAALNNDGSGSRGDIHKHMLGNYAKVEKRGGEEEERDIAVDKVRFLFVRHPFNRLASAYHDKFTTHAEPPFVRPVADYKVCYILIIYEFMIQRVKMNGPPFLL